MEFPKGNIGSYHYMPDFYLHEFWRFVFLQQKVGEYAQIFIDYPPMQRGASFNLEAVKAEIDTRIKAMKGKMEERPWRRPLGHSLGGRAGAVSDHHAS
jgi:hypothetical protein